MLPKQSSPRASFDTLPNEIILHIAEHFDRRQNRHRILYVLSRVNRRLYNFAQPFLLHRVTTSCKDLSSMSRFFQETNVGYANFVRFVLCTCRS
jgi:F-box-like